MRRIAQIGPLAITVLTVLGAGRPASGSEYGSVEDLWDRYCKVVGTRDEVEVLACYDEKLRSQLTGDKTAAGRARLAVHMSEMFELLFKDYDYHVVEQKEEGDHASYTVKFKSRKKEGEHLSTVLFAYDGDRWFITKNPELPSFLKAGTGTVAMVAGIAIALVAIGFLVKKALG